MAGQVTLRESSPWNPGRATAGLLEDVSVHGERMPVDAWAHPCHGWHPRHGLPDVTCLRISRGFQGHRAPQSLGLVSGRKLGILESSQRMLTLLVQGYSEPQPWIDHHSAMPEATAAQRPQENVEIIKHDVTSSPIPLSLTFRPGPSQLLLLPMSSFLPSCLSVVIVM